MTLEEFLAYLDRRSITYTRDGLAFDFAGGYLDLSSLTTLPEGVSLTAGGYLDLRSLTTLPEGVSLTAGGSLDLRSLTTLPEGVSLTAGGSLDLSSLTTLPEGVSLTAGGSLDLSSLTTLPEGVSLTAGGYLDLSSLTTLPEGVSLTAGGSLDLSSLTTLPEGVSLTAGGYLYLSSLTTLPEGVSLTAGGYLDLRSLTTLPEGVSLTAGGYLDLRSLTTLPEGVSLTAGGSLDLRSLTTLPEGVSLTAGGSLDLSSLTTLPEGVSLTAGGSLDLRSLTTLPEGVSLTAGGYLDLRSLTTLPEGVSLTAGGYLDLRSLTTLPEGVSLTAGGSLDLSSLTTLPEGVSLTAGGYLDLRSLTTLPEGVSLTAGGYLYLSSLTTLPEGVSLTAGGSLYLSSLTTLPEGVSLTAGGSLDLRSLTTEMQRYQGKAVRIRMIDGYAMRLSHKRKVGDAILWSAQYFKGDLAADPRCFVAQSDEDYAHGDTSERALRDLRFKVAQRGFDPDELVADIKRRGWVSFNDYRLLTGACESGLREGLRARGIDPDTEELPLDQVLKLSANGYGGDVFAKLMAALAMTPDANTAHDIAEEFGIPRQLETEGVRPMSAAARATPMPAPVEGQVINAATSLMDVISRAASDPSVDVDKLERLMGLYERVTSGNAERDFDIAMNAAQEEMRPIAADANNPQTKSRYASYAALDKALRPIYTKHGFSLSFYSGDGAPADHIRVACRVAREGHKEHPHIDMPSDGKGAKGGDVMTKTHATGAAITYGKRYLLGMIFNIAVGEDNDGNAPRRGRSGDDGPISEAQVKKLRDVIAEVGADEGRFLKFVAVATLADIPAYKFDAALRALEAKRVAK